MYKNNEKQLKFEDFYLPFGGKLRSDNRWVKLAKLIPWHDFEELYARTLAGAGIGAPAIRVAQKSQGEYERKRKLLQLAGFQVKIGYG